MMNYFNISFLFFKIILGILCYYIIIGMHYTRGGPHEYFVSHIWIITMISRANMIYKCMPIKNEIHNNNK